MRNLAVLCVNLCRECAVGSEGMKLGVTSVRRGWGGGERGFACISGVARAVVVLDLRLWARFGLWSELENGKNGRTSWNLTSFGL